MSLQSINPVDGQIIAEYPVMDDAEIQHILHAADQAQQDWREVPIEKKSLLMHAVAAQLRQQVDGHASLMTREMGKPISQSRSEIEKCAWVCDYYADHAADFLKPEPISTDASASYVRFDPLGVILAVMPWNFPYWQVFRFLAPALMSGNAALLKHASNVQGCAQAIARVLQDAGLPKYLFANLAIGSDQVETVLQDSLVKAVTLTGSEAAGRAVAAIAGESLKKSVLELGGSDPYIVLADADIQKAAEACVSSRMINSGQSCIAAKRLIVVESVADEFTESVVNLMQAKCQGDPQQDDTELGPMAREDLRDELHGQVMSSVAQGANIALGGEVEERPGAWYPATVLTDVAPGMPAFDEELFGPAAAIIRVTDEAQAIHYANLSVYGLGAAVFSQDLNQAEKIAAQLEAGAVAINDFVRSDPRMPFGGVKDSGYGRELSHYGMREFVNIKSVTVA